MLRRLSPWPISVLRYGGMFILGKMRNIGSELPVISRVSPNYVFKPTAEQALCSIQSAARRRLNTALDFCGQLVALHVKGAR